MSNEKEIENIFEMAGFEPSVLVEGGISRIMSHVNGKLPFAILTACRGALTPAENAARNKEMASTFRSLNLGYKHVDGSYIEENGGKVSEASFFVIGDKNISEEQFRTAMVNLGAKYDQDAILFGSPEHGVMLISAVDNDYIGPKGTEKKLGAFSPIRIGDYFSEWKGRPFIFKSLEEGFEANSRKEMGFFKGWAAELNRKKAAKS